MKLFLKNLLFTFFIPGTVAVYVPLLVILRAPPFPANVAEPWSWLAVAVLLVGTAIYLWCLWDFATFGRGTPAPIDAPKHLVVRGLYRYTRNPMYVGVLTVVFGWALYYGSTAIAVYGVLVWTGFHLFVVKFEEPTLAREFGAEYAEYCRRVRRWFVI